MITSRQWRWNSEVEHVNTRNISNKHAVGRVVRVTEVQVDVVEHNRGTDGGVFDFRRELRHECYNDYKEIEYLY